MKLKIILITLILCSGCATKQSFKLKSKVGINSDFGSLSIATLKMSYESR